jgi:hypothetical protein
VRCDARAPVLIYFSRFEIWPQTAANMKSLPFALLILCALTAAPLAAQPLDTDGDGIPAWYDCDERGSECWSESASVDTLASALEEAGAIVDSLAARAALSDSLATANAALSARVIEQRETIRRLWLFIKRILTVGELE